MNKRLQLPGGRSFRFAHTPKISELNTLKSNIIAVPLVTERYSLKALTPSKEIYAPKEPIFLMRGVRNRVEFGFPQALRFVGLSADNNVMHFEQQQPLQIEHSEENAIDRFFTSLVWLEMQCLLTGHTIDPFSRPRRIFLSTFNTEPFSAKIDAYIDPSTLAEGIEALRQLFGETMPITLLAADRPGSVGSEVLKIKDPHLDTLFIEEKYPAHDGHAPLTDHTYPAQVAKDPSKYWWLDTITVKKLSEIVNDVTIDNTILVGLGGSDVVTPQHLRVPPFTPLATITGPVPAGHRTITGGLFTGVEAHDPANYGVRPWDRGVSVISNPSTRELLHFLRPGSDRDSSSPTFLSWFLRGHQRSVHGGIRGEHRFCVSCNYCEPICPAGLDPSFLWKLCKEELYEEAAQYGLLRCSRCGLCSYTCPSKLDLANIIFRGKERWLETLREEAS